VLKFAARLIVAAALAGATMLALPRGLSELGLHPATAGGAAVALVAAGACGAVVYLVAARALRIGEVAALLGALRRR